MDNTTFNDLSFFNSLDSSFITGKTPNQYVVINSDVGVVNIQFIKPTQPCYESRFYVQCAIKNEYSNKTSYICYDPKDTRNPLVILVNRFKKLRMISNSNNPKLSSQAKMFLQTYNDIATLILGTGERDEKGFKNTGFCGTEYFVSNISIFTNSGTPIKTGIFSRGAKEGNGTHGKYTIHELGISWYVLYQAFKKRNLDLYKSLEHLYNYSFTIKINKPNFNDPNWFENNSLFEILSVNNPIKTNGFEEYNIEKAIRYTSYETLGNKMGSIFEKIDSRLSTNFKSMLREKIIEEQNKNSNSNMSSNSIFTNNNNINLNNTPNSGFNPNVTNMTNNFGNTNMGFSNNNNNNIPNANPNFNDTNNNFNTNNIIPNIPNSFVSSQVQTQQVGVPNNNNISNTNLNNNIPQQQIMSSVNIPSETTSNIQNNSDSNNSVSFDELFN